MSEIVDASIAEEVLENEFPNIKAIPEKNAKKATMSGGKTVSISRTYKKILPQDKDGIEVLFKEYPGFFSELENRGLAFWAASKRLEIISNDKAQKKEYYKEAQELKSKAIKILDLIAGDDDLVKKVIQITKPGTGYSDRAEDLAALYPHLKIREASLVEKTLMTAEEIDRIGRLPSILVDVSRGEKLAEAKLLKRQAWTYFLVAYREIRRYVECLHFYSPEELKKYPTLRS